MPRGAGALLLGLHFVAKSVKEFGRDLARGGYQRRIQSRTRPLITLKNAPPPAPEAAALESTGIESIGQWCARQARVNT